jgi:hypothetical protein
VLASADEEAPVPPLPPSAARKRASSSGEHGGKRNDSVFPEPDSSCSTPPSGVGGRAVGVCPVVVVAAAAAGEKAADLWEHAAAGERTAECALADAADGEHPDDGVTEGAGEGVDVRGAVRKPAMLGWLLLG